VAEGLKAQLLNQLGENKWIDPQLIDSKQAPFEFQCNHSLGAFILRRAVRLGDPCQLGRGGRLRSLRHGGSVIVVSDFEVYQSATVINGNVGMGPYDQLTHNIDATINGRFDYDLTDSNPGSQTGTITGGIHQIDLSGAAADARAASADAASRAFTQTYSTLAENQVIVGSGGLNVIQVTGDVTLKKGLTLQVALRMNSYSNSPQPTRVMCSLSAG